MAVRVVSSLSTTSAIYFLHRLVSCANNTMAPIDPAPWNDVFGVLASMATAVPELQSPLQGSIEALKQIRLYTEVSEVNHLFFQCQCVTVTYSESKTTRKTASHWPSMRGK
jgi:hypothetical protein